MTWAARLVEFASREYMVRGRGYARSLGDLRSIVVAAIRSAECRSLSETSARSTLGPDIRRGVADLDRQGRCRGRRRDHALGRECPAT